MKTTKSIQTFVVNNQYSTVQYNNNNNNWDTHEKSHKWHSMYFYMVNQASFSKLKFTCCFFRNHFSSHCPRDFVLFNTYYIGDQIRSSNVHKGPRELVIAWNNCNLYLQVLSVSDYGTNRYKVLYLQTLNQKWRRNRLETGWGVGRRSRVWAGKNNCHVVCQSILQATSQLFFFKP